MKKINIHQKIQFQNVIVLDALIFIEFQVKCPNSIFRIVFPHDSFPHSDITFSRRSLMICLLLPPFLLTTIKLPYRRVVVSPTPSVSFFSQFPSCLLRVVSSHLFSPESCLPFLSFFSSILALCIPQIVTSLSFFLSLFLFLLPSFSLDPPHIS